MQKTSKYLIIGIIPLLCLVFILYSVAFPLPLYDDTIHHAVENKSLAGLKKLLPQVKNIDIRDKNGKTALQIASTVNFDRVIAEFLIQNGSDVNQVSVDGVPLITEVLCSKRYSEKEKMLDLLVKHNADINKKDSMGNIPIRIAFKEFVPLKIIRHFMQYKPDVNILNNNGESALFIAVLKDDVSDVIILLENKADPNFICDTRRKIILLNHNKNHQFCMTGKSLLDIAEMLGYHYTERILKKYGAKASEELKNLESSIVSKNE